MDKIRIIDKIYKCLRLSASCNANEAAAAVRQAQRLMYKHGISESELVSANIGESSAPLAGGEVAFWSVALAELVAEAFACRAYLAKRRAAAAQWRFIGPGHAAPVSAYTFCILQRRLSQGREAFLQGLHTPDRAERARQADVFAQAWLLRISRTVGRFTRDAQVEEAIERYAEQRYGAVETSTPRAANSGQGDYEAIVRGLRAAEGVTLFRPVRVQDKPLAGLEGCV